MLVKRVNEDNGSYLTVVVAALNEEEGIGATLAELKAVLEDPDYLVVDGNSMDSTAEIAEEMGAKVVYQEGSGKGLAIAQALEHIGAGARYVAFTDADFTYPAKQILRMVEILEANPEVGMVTGSRFKGPLEFRKMRGLFYIGNRFLALTQHLFNGVHLNDPFTGLRVVRAEILRGWKPKSKGFDVEAELNHHVEKMGYLTAEIRIEYRERLGIKKLKMRDGFKILRRIITESLCAY